MLHKLIKTIFFSSFVWAAGASLTQGSLRADTIAYAVTNGSGIIGTVDLNTGVFTQIAAPGLSLSSVYGLGEYGGFLYGASPSCGCLFQLNPSTGAVTNATTTIGQSGSSFGGLNGFGSTAAGLFAVGVAFGGINSLYSVNPVTGTGTLIGSTAVTAGGGTGFLSASTDSDKLYWEVQNGCTDTLYSLDTSTGSATLIGAAAACSPSATGNPFALVFTGGTLWANFVRDGCGTINTSNGAQTLVSTNNFPAFAGLAPYPLATPALPVISAVVNGASFQAGGVTNSWVSIVGTNLSLGTDDWSHSIVNGTLPISLDGVSVSMGGKPAYIYYISPGQINVLAPDISPGPVSVTVTTANSTSAAFSATVSQYGPAFFLWPASQVVATHLDYSYAVQAGTFSGLTTVPAKPGEVIVLWATGFGPTSPAAPDGVVVPGTTTYNTLAAPTVMIDNIPALVYGAALASGSVGLYQIAIQVPATLANGTWPIQATIGGVLSPAGTVLTVHQ
jgi:uncharacterized protein (TIGR03437 family)